MARILVVDDEIELCNSISNWLKGEGHSTDTAYDGKAALVLLNKNNYDLVILDLLRPGLDGISLCKLYRAGGGSARILFLREEGEHVDHAAGLDAGGDDFISKPCDLKELSARVRALMRRSVEVSGLILQVGDLKLDTSDFVVRCSDETISLRPQEFALLEFFMRHPNVIFTTQTLIRHIWRGGASTDTVRTHVKSLRKKVLQSISNPQIKTIHGRGYCLSDGR